MHVLKAERGRGLSPTTSSYFGMDSSQGRRGWRLARWSAMATGAWLVIGARIAAAQEILVNEPQSGENIYAGESINVDFEATGGVVSPYFIYLYQGNDKVQTLCNESASCDIEDGNFVAKASVGHVGEGFRVNVTGTFNSSSSVSGVSDVFEILALPVTEFQEVGGGGGAVGNMNLAMTLVASICGLALAATLITACVKTRGLRYGFNQRPTGSAKGDVENGALVVHYPDDDEDQVSPTPDPKSNVVVHGTPARAFCGGDAELDKYLSPGTALARGRSQRGRSSSRESGGSPPDDQQSRGYRSVSHTPKRRRDGPVMMSTTPGKSGMMKTPVRERAIVSRSWDEPKGPRMWVNSPQWSQSSRDGRRARGRSLPRNIDERRLPPRGRSTPRHTRGSQGLDYGRSLSVGRGTTRYGDPEEDWEVELQRRAMERGAVVTTSADMRHQHARGRETRSVERKSSPSRCHSADPERSRRSRYYEGPRADGSWSWGHRDLVKSSSRHTPRRSGLAERRPRHHSERTMFSPDHFGRGMPRFSPARARSVGARSWGRREGSTSPVRYGSYRNFMTIEGHEQDVSWEELRFAHQKSSTSSRSRVLKSNSAWYGDVKGVSPASGSVDNSTRNGHPRHPPPPYHLTTNRDGGKLSIGVPFEVNGGVFSSNHTRSSTRSAKSFRYSRSKAPGSRATSAGDLSPSSRAKSAREAAREAQESAERALSAAAAASRAADLAAQAAIDAEEEADAERKSLEGVVKASPPVRGSEQDGGREEGGDNTPATSFSPPGPAPAPASISGASVRERAKATVESEVGQEAGSSTNGRGKVVDEASAAKAREALAVMGCSEDNNSVRLGDSWIAPRDGGPDIAGGSIGDHTSNPSMLGSRRLGLALVGGGNLEAQRRAFVRQYSRGSTFEGESEYSMHENPPPLIPMSVSAVGSMRRAPYMSPGSGLNSFDESEISFRDAQALDPPSVPGPPPLRLHTPKSPLSHVPPSSANGVEITIKKRESPSRAPDFKPRPRTWGEPAIAPVLNISEAGSSPEDSAGY